MPDVSLSEFSLAEMIQRSVSAFAACPDGKGIEFLTDLADNLPASVVSDAERLAQVAANLLSDALKFTPEGGAVTVSVKLAQVLRSDEESDVYVLEFRVAGAGRAKELTTDGVTASKQILELLGGHIWAESIESHGPRFFFRVPVLRGTDKSDKIE